MDECPAQAKGWRGRSGYRKGCRCAFCTEDWAAWVREYRKQPGVKERRRARFIEREYGLSEDEHAAMLEDQEHRCAACGYPQTGRNQYGPLPLHVDHSHRTGKVRGLLCLQCNAAIGHLQDDPERAEAVARYLRLHEEDT